MAIAAVAAKVYTAKRAQARAEKKKKDALNALDLCKAFEYRDCHCQIAHTQLPSDPIPIEALVAIVGVKDGLHTASVRRDRLVVDLTIANLHPTRHGRGGDGMFLFSDVKMFTAGLIILVCAYSMVTTNRRFYSEIAQPLTLLCVGIALGISIADAPL